METTMNSTPLPSVDFHISVKRSVKPIYPGWVKKKGIMHPELELAGPAEYDLQTDVQQWLYPQQEKGGAQCYEIYDRLRMEGIDSCLNLQDGYAIQAKGINVFTQVFGDSTVYLWGSVVTHGHRTLRVPCLYIPLCRKPGSGFELGKVVVLEWEDLNPGITWFSNRRTLRFLK